MQSNRMHTWLKSSYLFKINQSYIENIYEEFLKNPNSVDVNWKKTFQKISEIDQLNQDLNFKLNYKFIKLLQLINAFRLYGYQSTNLDPLKLQNKQKYLEELYPSFYDLTKEDMQKTINLKFLNFKKNILLKPYELYHKLKNIYCKNIGIEYMHIFSSKEKSWIQDRIEFIIEDENFLKNFLSKTEKKRFLNELIYAEEIEKYLGYKFPGIKRFSLEGCDVLIPILKEIIRFSRKNHNTKEIILGMTHRGRLNVLINVFGKNFKELFNEFIENDITLTGDVKYHQGFSSDIETESGLVHLSLIFNPSHLEIVNPVVMGSTRARIDKLKSSSEVLPITLHGDAAFIGQGVVQETLNMSKVRGYEVGGTLRIVINNQIGFTTSNIEDARSTKYCTDIAKMLHIPIFHVNADDLASVIFVTRIALDFRNIFKKDVIIDLVCYRRHGHNEIDEPSITQPIMYQKIKQHPTLTKIYSDLLKKEGIISNSEIDKMINLFINKLDKVEFLVKNSKKYITSSNLNQSIQNNNEIYKVKVEKNKLKQLCKVISDIPNNIKIQYKVAKIYQNRSAMASCERSFDWGGAEILAYATLIDEGISIRLSGEDTARGTFSHRHAVIHNQQTGETYTPLFYISNKKGATFQVWDSVLSEEAVLAFEYGYSITASSTLVIWEAQFGDFSNGAQIVIDQFISSGEKKWGQMSNLVMLLPHGYDGQGPDHSSARIERYLQLCAENNMQVCIPSTPSQFYHIIRRQAFIKTRRPLIIMSPKSLLRHSMAISSLEDLTDGKFYPAIDEIDNLDIKNIKRVIICSGKIYYDLLNQRRKNKQYNVAIVRLEQLYPFPTEAVKKILFPYIKENVLNFVWCQEEPKNQGAWQYSRYFFQSLLSINSSFNYVGRDASAASAVGYFYLHKIQQEFLINKALNVNSL